jgi:hypothetical protein
LIEAQAVLAERQSALELQHASQLLRPLGQDP